MSGCRGVALRKAAALALAAFLAPAVLPGCSGSRWSEAERPGVERQEQESGAGEEAGLPEEGEKAVGGAPAFDPSREIVIKRGDPDRKEVTLTIDDGWNRDDRILDLLESYNIKATVFVVGGRGVAEGDPEWIRRMDRMGWEVCTHTYDHYKLTDHPYQYVVEDIRKGQEVIAAVTGKTYPYMRPSGGAYNETVIQACRDLGCYLVMWSNSLGDTDRGTTAEKEAAAALGNLKNGDIILCHFGGYHTYEALSLIIPEVLSRGYRFVTLTELLFP